MPSSPSPSPNPLESYLHLLDTYTSLQTTLQSQLRTAFLSLSKAQFHAGQPGISTRFGPDWFDDRARAALRVRVGRNESGSGGGSRGTDVEEVGFETVRMPYSVRKGRRKVDSATNATVGTSAGVATSAGVSLDGLGSGIAALSLGADSSDERSDERSDQKSHQKSDQKSDQKDERDEEEEEEEVITNPLFQFGMLVPQALRQAQSEFTACAEVMVRIVGVERRMRGLEKEIGKGGEGEGGV